MEGSMKSGPRELALYHAQQLAATPQRKETRNMTNPRIDTGGDLDPETVAAAQDRVQTILHNTPGQSPSATVTGNLTLAPHTPRPRGPNKKKAQTPAAASPAPQTGALTQQQADNIRHLAECVHLANEDERAALDEYQEKVIATTAAKDEFAAYLAKITN
jgi:hypothetical protein